MQARTTLRTERLVLRPLTPADIDDVVALLNDYDVSKWLTVVPYPYRPEDARVFLAGMDAVGPYEGYAITIDGGTVIGGIGISDSLGYWLGRAHHGHGYMTEAARGLVGHWFATSGENNLKSGYFSGNTASAAVLGKLGFRASHDETVQSRARNAEVTIHQMRLSRADWEAGHG